MANKTRTLYNEYRPKQFADVVGQTVPVQTMENAVKSGNVASAYLFSGERGIGKTTCARIFAKALLCIDTERETSDGCSKCEACAEFQTDLARDFIEIDAATNRGIDNIREIKERVYMAPVTSDRKVVLIDEVHHLTNDAATALLKILEEPPEGVVFMLATTDPQKIPATIRSRCQWLKFRPLDSRQIEDRLSYVLGREGLSADTGVAAFIAKRAAGGLRDALSMLDMLITYAGSERISMQDAETCFGAVGQDLVDELVGYITTKDLANCVGFTVRHRTSDVSARDMVCALHDMLSLGIIINQCGTDSAYALESASTASIDCATKLKNELGIDRLLLAADVIERSMWKFDSSALDDAHIFNEIILAVADPMLDPKHLSLDEADRQLLAGISDKTGTISKAVSTMAGLQKKTIESLTDVKNNVQKLRQGK